MRQLLKRLHRWLVLRKARRAYAALRRDKRAWEEYRQECRLLDATLLDGLKDL